ncbi:MAG: glycosyltransferase [Acidobacteriota bacterium]|nr:glycosyltransferase [Acidobacteriota bacterium]
MTTTLHNPQAHKAPGAPAAAACDVVVVGQFPPPVHGFAQATKDVAALLEARGLRVERLDLKPIKDRESYLSCLRIRLSQIAKAVAAVRSGARVYLALSGGVRQAVDLIFLVIGRIGRARIHIHHHSFAYLDRPTLLTRLCFLAAGESATHIVLCGVMKRELQANYKIARNVGVISNACLQSVRSAPRVRTEVRCIGYFSALTREKGILEFLRVAAQLAERHPELKFPIAGPCHEAEILSEVQKASRNCAGIDYIGPVYGEEKNAFLESLDVLLFPTSYRNEAEPLVILEAISSGIPVIARERGCIGEMLAMSDCQSAAIPREAPFVATAVEQIERWLAVPQVYSRRSACVLDQFERVAEQSERDFDRIFLDAAQSRAPRRESIRLLHVIQSVNAESGGPIEALLRISEVLTRRGHHVEVVSLDSPEEMAHDAMPLPAAGVGPGVLRYTYTPRLTSWLKRNSGRFDVVILHGLWDYSAFGAWRALRKSGTPYFVFAHGMMDPWFREKYPLKHIAKQIYWLLGIGRVLRDARAVLFTCEEERVRSRDSFWGYAYKEEVVAFGTADAKGDANIEKAAFESAMPALKDKPFLLYMGRIHPKKGCDLVIQAFAETVARNSTLDLVMAGPDQVGWAHELKALAKKLRVSDRIHWTGMLRGDMKWGALRSAEALILPSHQENFGIVVAEAMACSTPVLVSDKVNIWREIQSANAGIAETDDLAGTRRLITRFCALSQDRREQMGDAARSAFLRYFDIEAATRDLLRVIGPALE